MHSSRNQPEHTKKKSLLFGDRERKLTDVLVSELTIKFSSIYYVLCVSVRFCHKKCTRNQEECFRFNNALFFLANFYFLLGSVRAVKWWARGRALSNKAINSICILNLFIYKIFVRFRFVNKKNAMFHALLSL